MLADKSTMFQVNVWFQVKTQFNFANGWQKGQAQFDNSFYCLLGELQEHHGL